jgi:hypothetical protein
LTARAELTALGRTPRIRRFAVHYWVRRKECASWEAVRVDKELIQVEHIREWIRREQGHETDESGYGKEKQDDEHSQRNR